MACLVRRHSSPALVVPHHVGGVVVAVQAQRLAELGSSRRCRVKQAAGRPCAQVAASRRAWQGSGWQVQRVLSVQVWLRTGRVWTGPNDGAVNVANTAGWVATVG